MNLILPVAIVSSSRKSTGLSDGDRIPEATRPSLKRFLMGYWLLWTAFGFLQAAPFQLDSEPSLDRWMYPFNASPGFRPAAPVFATFGDESGVDTRHGQFILGWDTASQIASQLPAQRYRVTAARLTLRTLREGSFLNDSTEDPWASYLPTNSVSYRPDTDPGRPVELFGDRKSVV